MKDYKINQYSYIAALTGNLHRGLKIFDGVKSPYGH